MIESIAAAQRCLHGNTQNLLELTLTDVILQTPGPQAVITASRCRWIKVISRLPSSIHHAIDLTLPAWARCSCA